MLHCAPGWAEGRQQRAARRPPPLQARRQCCRFAPNPHQAQQACCRGARLGPWPGAAEALCAQRGHSVRCGSAHPRPADLHPRGPASRTLTRRAKAGWMWWWSSRTKPPAALARSQAKIALFSAPQGLLRGWGVARRRARCGGGCAGRHASRWPAASGPGRRDSSLGCSAAPESPRASCACAKFQCTGHVCGGQRPRAGSADAALQRPRPGADCACTAPGRAPGLCSCGVWRGAPLLRISARRCREQVAAHRMQLPARATAAAAARPGAAAGRAHGGRVG